MNEHPVNLYTSVTNSVRTENTVDYEIVIQALKNFDINSKEMKKEVKFLEFDFSRHKEKYKSSFFGENESVLYKFVFVTYNTVFLVKLMTFQYDNKSEILKLDIQPETNNVQKELEYCCNALQRRRNLNLMFTTLITFARFIESRRLICDLILKKNRNIKIEQNKDGGIIIVYSDEIRNIKLGIFWSIQCSSVLKVKDVVEVYYKVVELQSKKDIINKLEMLTHSSLDFTKKYHLWKGLIEDLSERSLIVVIDKIQDTSKAEVKSPPQTPKKSLVVMIDKISNTSKATTTTSNNQTGQDSDSEDSAEKSLVVVIDKMPNTSKGRSSSLNPPISKQKLNKDVILMCSDSEDSKKKSLMVVLDKMPSSSLEEAICCQENKEKEAVGVAIVSSDSDSEDVIEKGALINIPDSNDMSQKAGSLNTFSAISTDSFYRKSRNKTAYSAPIDLSDSEDDQCNAASTSNIQKSKEKELEEVVLMSDSDGELSTEKEAQQVDSTSSDLKKLPEKLVGNALRRKKAEEVSRDSLDSLGASSVSTKLKNKAETSVENTSKKIKNKERDTDSPDTEGLSRKFRNVLTNFFKGVTVVKSQNDEEDPDWMPEERLPCNNNNLDSDSDVEAKELEARNTDLLRITRSSSASRLPLSPRKSLRLRSDLEEPVVGLSLTPKRRKTSDDLEITSVTYVVPD